MGVFDVKTFVVKTENTSGKYSVLTRQFLGRGRGHGHVDEVLEGGLLKLGSGSIFDALRYFRVG